MPPTKYLGLPWPEWGETDVLLTTALDLHESSTCQCGCNQPRDLAHDPDLADRWQPQIAECYAGTTLREFVNERREEIGHRLVYLTLLPEGQTANDPLEYDPAQARAEYEALQARHAPNR